MYYAREAAQLAALGYVSPERKCSLGESLHFSAGRASRQDLIHCLWKYVRCIYVHCPPPCMTLIDIYIQYTYIIHVC